MQFRLSRLVFLALLPVFSAGNAVLALNAHASPLAGIWQGQYICGQGGTAVTVELSEADANGDVHGVFTFRNMPGKTNVSPGKFAVSGSYDAKAGKLEIWPAGWILRPPRYVPVGFSANLDLERGQLTGHMHHHTCSAIELERTAG
jgi:hypothetical protein